MKWTIGTKIGIGYALAIAILMVMSAVNLRRTASHIETSQFVVETREFLDQLKDIGPALREIQSDVRGYVITGEDNLLDAYRAADARMEKEVMEAKIWIKNDPRYRQQLEVIERSVLDGIAFYREVVAARKDSPNGLESAQRLLASLRGKKFVDSVTIAAREIEMAERSILKQRGDASEASARSAIFTILAGTLAGLVLLALSGIVVTRNISKPLNEVAGVAERIAGGDLTINVRSDGRQDEIGTLTRSFHGMAENLRRVTGEIQDSANVLGSSASQILASTTQVASAAAETATAVSQTSATVEEVKQTAQVSVRKARYVSDTAQKSAQISQTGKKSVEDVVDGMMRIREQMEAIAESMVRLSEQSQVIGQIIATVQDLTAQSNLLAVNAAIEAAKAGEQGKGFAAIAQEVKSLADQSKQATAQVRAILTDIQKATSAAVVATEQGSKVVEAVVKQSAQAGQSIQTLAGSVTEAAQAAAQIAASSQEQLIGVDQVALAMGSIKQASIQNADSAQQLDSAARNLEELGQKLKHLIARYQV